MCLDRRSDDEAHPRKECGKNVAQDCPSLQPRSNPVAQVRCRRVPKDPNRAGPRYYPSLGSCQGRDKFSGPQCATACVCPT
jgi:hypothetical protein